MRTPVVGTTLQTMALARLSWTLSLALNAGIDASRAIRMALDSTQNRYYTQHIDKAEAVIMRRRTVPRGAAMRRASFATTF